jgi:hypothetical protein
LSRYAGFEASQVCISGRKLCCVRARLSNIRRFAAEIF